MIEIKNVSKSFNKENKVIDDISIEVNDGEIFGFIGLNGAGKTTTIKMMMGILEIDEGDVFIDGNSIISNPIKAKMNLGYVPDSPDMFLKMKGIEYLNFIADTYKIPTEIRKDKINYYAKEFEMLEYLEGKIESYSHGMRQKIVVIGALIHSPKNLILDEPITGLDPKSSFNLKRILKDYANNGNTVFFSTHILEIAERLCDKVGIIDKGKLLFIGSLDNLREKYGNDGTLEEIFIKLVEHKE